MVYTLPEMILTEVDKYVQRAPYATSAFLNLMEVEGLRRATTVKWKSNFDDFRMTNDKVGFAGYDALENAPNVGSDLTKVSAKLVSYSGKLVLSPAQIAQIEGNELNIQINAAAYLSRQIDLASKWINCFITCGQSGRYIRTDDPFYVANASLDLTVTQLTLNGMFFDYNVLTAVNDLEAGIDGDDNVTAYGDFLDWCAKVEKIAQDNGLDDKNVYIPMDTGTMQKFNTHIATNNSITELAMAKQTYPGWKFLGTPTILANTLTSNHYMGFIIPKDNKQQPTMRLIESLPVQAIPVGGGTLQSSGNFEWFIAWKGGIIIDNPYAVGLSEALTIS